MPDAGCPENDELMAEIDGAPSSPETARHIDGCESCRRRADELRAGVTTIRHWMSRAADLIPPPGAAPLQAEQPLFIEQYFVGGVVLREPGLVVYRASHTVVQSEVSLFLFDQTIEPQTPLAEMLVQEAKHIAAIRNRALPPVHDLGFFRDAPFLVASNPSGERLDRCLAGQARAPADAARLTAQLAEAVAAMHEQGVIHGLIVPQLVLLSEDAPPQSERAWLLGNGVAWLAQTMRSAGTSNSTAEAFNISSTFGSDRRPYLAPELLPGITAKPALGEAPSMTSAADVFALGGLLHLLLTGSSPDAALTKLANCGAPPSLLRLTRQTLSTDARQRPTAADLSAELRRAASPRRLSKPVLLWLAAILAIAAAAWLWCYGQ